jgi:hypothetical protein
MAEIDHQLRRDVAHVANLVAAINQSVAVVGQQVNVVDAQQREARGQLDQLRQELQAFVQESERSRRKQLAETRIGSLQDKIDHEFGHYKEVRRTAIGTLQSFDLGIIAEDTVRLVAEQAALQTPGYWLAPAIVALGAWVADDREVCERAVEEAFRRDQGRTSLFMSLVLRRQQRGVSSVRWLKHYLDAQDPMALGRDFAVILEAIAQGAFGPAGLALAAEFLDRWRTQLAQVEAANQAQVVRWRAEMDSHTGPTTVARYPRLAAISPQFPQMDYALTHAAAHQSIYDKYTAMLTEEIVPTDRIEDAIDDILDRLVQEDNKDELPMRRELALQKAISAEGGDLDRAQRTIDADYASYETTLDFLTIQTQSALSPDKIGVSRSTQRVAVASCREWFGRAHGEYALDYRKRLPDEVEATFSGDHNLGAKAFRLPPWTGSFVTPVPELEQSLAMHWDRHVAPYLAALRPQWKKPAIIAGIGIVFGFLLLTACANVGVALVVAAVAGGITWLVLYQRVEAARKVEAQQRDLLGRAKQDSIAQLRAAGAELADWITAYRGADGVEPRVIGLIDSLATATNTASPFERRVSGGAIGGTP